MRASIALATLPAAKLYIGIHDHDSRYDALLTALIDYASARIERHCLREFAAREVIEYMDGTGHERGIQLSEFPVSRLIAIYEDSAREFGNDTERPLSEFRLHTKSGIVGHDGPPFARGARTVKILYTTGYTIIPEDLAAACIKLVATWYATIAASGAFQDAFADYETNYANAPLPADVESLTAPYVYPQWLLEWQSEQARVREAHA
jgi:hypothetical protein